MRLKVEWAVVMLAALAFSQGSNAAAETGRWVIVPMPSGVKVEAAAGVQPGVWRLNTETGALQFCFYNGSATAVGINCSSFVVPGNDPLGIRSPR